MAINLDLTPATLVHPARIVEDTDQDVGRKKVSIFSGRVLDGNALFVDFPNCICRNKMVVQFDQPAGCYLLPSKPTEGAFRSWWGSWGCHQVVFYGDLRDPFKEIAKLKGFEVVEAKP